MAELSKLPFEHRSVWGHCYGRSGYRAQADPKVLLYTQMQLEG